METGVGIQSNRQLLSQQACALDRQLLAYAELDQALAQLIQRPRHAVVVPISDVAFVPGEITDTNCILALIGDQTFVEKTNDGARKLIERRRQRLEQERGELMQVLEEQIVEICEPYVNDETTTRSAPNEPPPDPLESFETFWARLGNDHLEAQEEQQNRHGCLEPKPESAPSEVAEMTANSTTTTNGDRAPRKLSRFKVQRQNLNSN